MLVLSALTLTVLASPGALLGQAPDAAVLAARIQARQATIQDFTANFTETVSSPLLPNTSKEQGEIKIKKPGRLRMAYRTGDRNVYVADGKTLYSHFVPDRYVTQSPLPDADEAPTWLSFLSGRGDLARDFNARLADPQPPDEWHLLLTPRQPQADFASLTLQVDRKSLQLRGLTVVNTQRTTNHYRFSNLRENVALPDREFLFQMPRGVVIKN